MAVAQQSMDTLGANGTQNLSTYSLPQGFAEAIMFAKSNTRDILVTIMFESITHDQVFRAAAVLTELPGVYLKGGMVLQIELAKEIGLLRETDCMTYLRSATALGDVDVGVNRERLLIHEMVEMLNKVKLILISQCPRNEVVHLSAPQYIDKYICEMYVWYLLKRFDSAYKAQNDQELLVVWGLLGRIGIDVAGITKERMVQAISLWKTKIAYTNANCAPQSIFNQANAQEEQFVPVLSSITGVGQSLAHNPPDMDLITHSYTDVRTMGQPGRTGKLYNSVVQGHMTQQIKDDPTAQAPPLSVVQAVTQYSNEIWKEYNNSSLNLGPIILDYQMSIIENIGSRELANVAFNLIRYGPRLNFTFHLNDRSVQPNLAPLRESMEIQLPYIDISWSFNDTTHTADHATKTDTYKINGGVGIPDVVKYVELGDYISGDLERMLFAQHPWIAPKVEKRLFRYILFCNLYIIRNGYVDHAIRSTTCIQSLCVKLIGIKTHYTPPTYHDIWTSVDEARNPKVPYGEYPIYNWSHKIVRSIDSALGRIYMVGAPAPGEHGAFMKYIEHIRSMISKVYMIVLNCTKLKLIAG